MPINMPPRWGRLQLDGSRGDDLFIDESPSQKVFSPIGTAWNRIPSLMIGGLITDSYSPVLLLPLKLKNLKLHEAWTPSLP